MQSRTKDILFKVGTAIVCILAYAMTSNLENNVARPSFAESAKTKERQAAHRLTIKLLRTSIAVS